MRLLADTLQELGMPSCLNMVIGFGEKRTVHLELLAVRGIDLPNVQVLQEKIRNCFETRIYDYLCVAY